MPAHLGRRIGLLCQGEAGQSLTEYAMAIALIAVTLIVALLALRNGVGGVLNGTAATVSRQASSSGYGQSGGSPGGGGNASRGSNPGDSSGTASDSLGASTQR
jgi:Flp pilus assembly pilin Flp